MKQSSLGGSPQRELVLVAIAALLFGASGCDNSISPRINLPSEPAVPIAPGPTISESRAISGVTSITLEAVGLVDIRFGATESLRITAPQRVMSLLTSNVVGGDLVLGRDSPNYQGHASDIRYEITLRQLEGVALTGVGEIVVHGLDSHRFSARLEGVGDVRVSGRVDRQTVLVAGLGAYLAPRLESRIADLNLSSGRAEIWATDRIEGIVGFGCVVDYWGDPIVTVTGRGNLHRLGAQP